MASVLRLQAGRPTAQDSLIPFLYRTRTLLQRYSSEADGTAAFSRKQREPRRSTWERQDTAEEGTGRFARGGLQSNSSRRRPSSNTKDGDLMHSIPFEGDTMSKLEGTTMTPKEFYKFETLMRKKVKESGMTSKQQQTDHSIPRNKPAKLEFPGPLQDLAKEAEQMKRKSNSPATSLEVPSEYLVQVKGRMDNASSDVALWSILQNDVLNKIIALQEEFSMRQMQKLQESNKLHELTRSVPTLLVHYMRLIRTTFQGSSFGPILLPSLKKLGASAFALMATTELYNEHMHIMYRQYSDLDAIVQTLSEMDQEVYEFDRGTQGLLASIITHAHASMRGRNGPGQQALWLTDRKTRSLSKLERWNQTVDMRVQAAAMRKARESSADLVGV